MRTLLLLSASWLAASVVSQQPPAPGGDALSPAAFRLPLHRAGDGQLWAVGDAYKARFAADFTFHPALGGAAKHSLPLSWRTESIRAGGEALALSADALAASGSRCELRHRGVTEAYDVRSYGVEQTFVLATAPRGGGDLEIVGRVTTELCAPALLDSHQPVVFRDTSGVPVLSYGAATAFDSCGRKALATTRWDGARITLRLDRAWLAAASYPVTVDPLTTVVSISQWSGGGDGRVSSMDIAVENDTQGGRILVAYSRAYSAQDHDAYAYVCGRDFEWPVKVLSTVDPANDDRDVCAAYVAGAGRWVVAFSRAKWSGGAVVDRNVRVCFVDRTSTTLNGGPAVDIPRLSAEHFAHPDLGGTYNGDRALLVYERTAGAPSAASAEVVAVAIDPANAQLLSAWPVGVGPAGTSLERRRPAVTQVGGSYGWLVAWQERSLTVAGDDWDIEATRTDPQGGKRESVQLVDGGVSHAVHPVVGGSPGRALVAYGRSTGLASADAQRIDVRRIDWELAQPTPVLGIQRTVTTSGGVLSSLAPVALAADLDTRWHWALAYTRSSLLGTTAHVARLGRTGGVTESQALPLSPTAASSFAPAVTYDPATDRFPVAYATDATFAVTRDPVIGTHLAYPPEAITQVYGQACGAALIRATEPYAGNGGFSIYMVGTPPSAAAVLVLGPSPVQTPLDSAGMTGCTLLCDPVVTINLVTGAGVGQVALPLPDVGTLALDVRSQFFYAQAGANPLGVVATAGLFARVR